MDVRRPPAAGSASGHTRRRRPAAAGAVTALAALLVFAALVVPGELGELGPLAFVRIPAEALLAAAAVLALARRTRARRVVATLAGLALGLLTVLRIIDLGFQAALARPFHPLLDWELLDDAVSFLADSVGRAGAVAAVVGAVLLALAVPALMTAAVGRLSGVLVRHRQAATRATGALAVVWLACALAGAQLVAPVPVAARGALSLAYKESRQVSASLADREAFARELAGDAYRDTPGDQLLTALRGKDVVISFVESYGRAAVEDPALAPQVGAVLDEGTRRLQAAGYSSRSGFLTSPTAGAGSILAHATLLSGLWIDNTQRLRSLMSSDRTTLSSAFRRASWQTVAVMPGNTRAWPEGDFYGYQRVYAAGDVGYRGPSFSWATMPDQYALSAFERAEHGRKNRPPQMTQINLVSSHSPWAPIPRQVSWADVGDGTVFDPMASEGEPAKAVWENPDRVRAAYRRSIEYSLSTLISYVETYGDDNLVLVFLGDHQPAPVVTGEGASRDVPITIVARDPAVLDRIASWGWQDGLRPGPGAPVWRMDTFRDRFLAAFGSAPESRH